MLEVSFSRSFEAFEKTTVNFFYNFNFFRWVILQWGLEYWTHWNTKRFEALISNGSVLEWLVIAIASAIVKTIQKTNHWKSKQNGGHFVLISNGFGQKWPPFFSKPNTIGKLNTIEKLNRGLPLEFRTSSVFQSPLYSHQNLIYQD